MLKLSNNPLPLMLLCTLLSCLSTIINADTLDSQVISAGGDRIVASDKVMTYTIGQPFVFPNPSSSLQVGFLTAKSVRIREGSGCDTTQAEWACVEFKGIKDSYQVGDIIKIDTSLNVKWVVIQFPSGDLFYQTDLLNKIVGIRQPFKESLDILEVSPNLVDLELSPGLGGTYVFYALYVTEGTNPFDYLDDLTTIQRSELLIKTTTLANK